MRKISSLRDLKKEKKRVRKRQEELETTIRQNWTSLKQQLRPGTMAKEALHTAMDSKKEEYTGNNLFKETLQFGISLLAKKFTDKAGEKLTTIFSKSRRK